MSHSKRQLLYELMCYGCKKYFLYCLRSGSDFRCYGCKSNKEGTTVEEIEQELESMSKEERKHFEYDIIEYEKEYGKIVLKDDDEL